MLKIGLIIDLVHPENRTKLNRLRRLILVLLLIC